MNKAKCNEYDYFNFLVAAQTVFSTTEATRSHPDAENGAVHDAYTRLLQCIPPDRVALCWKEVKPLVKRKQGVLVIDDSTLDKPHASKMALVTSRWSGKHHQVRQVSLHKGQQFTISEVLIPQHSLIIHLKGYC